MLAALFKDLDRGLLVKLVIVQSLLITISNYLVHFKFAIAGFPLAYSIWCTPLFMVITDLMTRLSGKQLARAVLVATLIPGMIGTAIGAWLYGSDLISGVRLTVASGICYLLPMMLDVSIFAWLRSRISAWYVAPGISGIITTILMTYLFWGAAFAGDGGQFSEIWYIVATNQILVKNALNLLFLIPLYGVLLAYLTRRIQEQHA
jgi:uncharacterized PurR-regulated membrane protein YhhQ (DUF165 family)